MPRSGRTSTGEPAAQRFQLGTGRSRQPTTGGTRRQLAVVGWSSTGLRRYTGKPRAQQRRPLPSCCCRGGVRLEAARKRKEAKYPELLSTRRCRLVVVAMEVGGRWSEEAWSFLAQLAKNRAAIAPALLRRSAEYCFLRRWSQMLAVAAQTAFAATLLGEPSGKTPAWNDCAPELGEVLNDRDLPAQGPSRLA